MTDRQIEAAALLLLDATTDDMGNPLADDARPKEWLTCEHIRLAMAAIGHLWKPTGPSLVD